MKFITSSPVFSQAKKYFFFQKFNINRTCYYCNKQAR